MPRSLLCSLCLLFACSAEPAEDPSSDLDTLAGLWVGSELDVLNVVDHREGVEGRGDCDDGDDRICDSVLELTVEGTEPGATAEELQFVAAGVPNIYEAQGTFIPDGMRAFGILSDSRRHMALLILTQPGPDAALYVSMKDRYREDPGLPEEQYDATRLDGRTFRGRTYAFDLQGDPQSPQDDQELTLRADAPDGFRFDPEGRIHGEDLTGTPPRLTYDPNSVDSWLGIYHSGQNLPVGTGNLQTQTEYRTVIGIPGREASSLLVVTCRGDTSECSNGRGEGLETWDLERYRFTLLTR
ncbi:MAG: hypothetical protein EA397_04285 [Deltaproteobacteria bacterium]|nr:MAG: hypothetical protein EA397_04285 [Deltaproteobacteria bacterium]